MDVPARLAAGERLYRDVTYNYGPVSPWLNALALRIFGHRWSVLEAVGVLLAAAILVLLYRLTRRAGSPLSALVATTLAAAFCLGAPHGGAFVFPYSFANLYALAGSLLALLAYGSERRGAPLCAALGLALALAARPEIGAATALLLLIAGLRSRVDHRPGLRKAVLIILGAGLTAAALYGAAFAGIPWPTLEREVPFLHLASLPPEWKHYYRGAAGLLHPWRAARTLAAGLALDVLLLAACAWMASRRRAPGIVLPVLLVAVLAAWALFVSGNELPPLLFPLPLIAPLAAAAVFLRRPFGPRERDRFLLFALAAVDGIAGAAPLAAGPGDVGVRRAGAAVLAGYRRDPGARRAGSTLPRSRGVPAPAGGGVAPPRRALPGADRAGGRRSPSRPARHAGGRAAPPRGRGGFR